METNMFLSCSAFQFSVTSLRTTITPPASPSRVSGEMLPCRRLWPPRSWRIRRSGRSGAESITASMAAAVSRSGKRSGRLMPSRKWVPRKCSARGFMRTGSRRMLSTTTPSCIELIIWCERLRSPASSERYFSCSRTIRPCCAARSTTQMRFSGLLGLTRKSKAPWRVISTAASTEARAEVITTTVRPLKRLMIWSVRADPSMPGMDRGTRATSQGDSARRRRALPASPAVRTMQPRRSRIRRSPSRIPSSTSITSTRIGSRSRAMKAAVGVSPGSWRTADPDSVMPDLRRQILFDFA